MSTAYVAHTSRGISRMANPLLAVQRHPHIALSLSRGDIRATVYRTEDCSHYLVRRWLGGHVQRCYDYHTDQYDDASARAASLLHLGD